MENKKIYKKWWFWTIIVVIVIGIAGMSDDDKEKTKTKKDNKVDNEIIFLDGTNSDEFVKILSEVTGIKDIDGVETGDSITYSKSNDRYGISVDADKKSKKIDYVQIISYTNEDSTNVFMSLNRMNYSSEDDAKLTDWLADNIGTKSSIKIGDANFELDLTATGNPYLVMKTDGSDDYMKEQINKTLNSK